jgi:hypothetical protein
MEGKDIYILLAFALSRPTGYHPAYPVDDARLMTPYPNDHEPSQFSNMEDRRQARTAQGRGLHVMESNEGLCYSTTGTVKI